MDTLIVYGAKYLFAVVLLGAVSPLIWLSKQGRIRFLVSAVIAGIIAVALTKGSGAVYVDPRPFTEGVRSLISHEADNGFPSDHTVLSFTAAMLAFAASRRLGVVLLALALVVGACRVLSGVHHPIDAIAGAAFGLIAAVVGTFIGSRVSGERLEEAA
jgi:undecaprenyl-diphosphatase